MYILTSMSTTDTVMEFEPNDTDRAILTEIVENGRASTSLLAQEVDVSRTYASDRVRRLRENGYLKKVAPNIYNVTEKGLDEAQEE